MRSRDSPLGVAMGRGVFFWVPALPGLPGCSACPSPDLPTRGRQRLVVSAPTSHGCHRVPATAPGLRGDPWAVWGLWAVRGCGLRGANPTLHCTRSSLEPGYLNGMANGWWLGLVHVTSPLVWEELGQREHRLDSLSCGLVFFGVKKWKYVVVDNFFLPE